MDQEQVARVGHMISQCPQEVLIAKSFWHAAIVGGLVAGSLDLAYAVGVSGLRGTPPMVILQSVASGLLGRSAYSGGLATASFGTALHYMMTFLMSLVFLATAKRFEVIRLRPAFSGIGYGLILVILMNYVVVPLSSAYPGRAPQGLMLFGTVCAHVFLVGLPISFITRWYSRKEKPC